MELIKWSLLTHYEVILMTKSLQNLGNRKKDRILIIMKKGLFADLSKNVKCSQTKM